MIGIYMFENKKTHKKYIGQSTNIERRRKEHISSPSPYSYFDKELAKIGENQFIFSILEECNVEDLDQREIYWIQFYDSVDTGYNLCQGGQSYRGISNPQAKLSDFQVLEIIKLLEEHKLSNKQISKIYNVCQNTIDGINRCKHWTHLHNYKNNIRQENLNKEQYIHSSLAGENNPTSKINEKTALFIIELLKKDKRSIAQLAKDYNISLNILYDINRCKTWNYLHNYKSNIRNEYKKGECNK